MAFGGGKGGGTGFGQPLGGGFMGGQPGNVAPAPVRNRQFQVPATPPAPAPIGADVMGGQPGGLGGLLSRFGGFDPNMDLGGGRTPANGGVAGPQPIVRPQIPQALQNSQLGGKGGGPAAPAPTAFRPPGQFTGQRR